MNYLKPLPLLLIPLIWLVFYTNVFSCRTNYAVQGLEAFQSGEFEKASVSLTKAIDSGIKDNKILVELHYYRGLSWLQLKEFERCAADGDVVIRLGQSAEGHVLRGGAMFMLNRYDQAAQDFSRALEMGLNNEASALARLSRARAYIESEQWDQAFTDAEVLIKADTLNQDALVVRAQVWMERKNYEKCLADSSQALALDCEGKMVAETVRVAALMGLGRDAEALGDINRLVAQVSDPQLLNPMYGLRMIVYSRLEKYDKCLEDLQRIIELGVNPGEAYGDRCGIFEVLGEDEKAIADADKAIELGERTSFVYLNRAVCLQRLGRLEEANQDWDKAMSLEPRADLPHFYRGLAYAHGQDDARAVTCWREGIELHEKSNGKFSDDKKGMERLRVACDKAKATLKDNSDAYLVSGWLYWQTKDHSQAEQDLKKAVSLNPKNEMAERLLAGVTEKKTGVIEKNGRKMLRLAPAS